MDIYNFGKKIILNIFKMRTANPSKNEMLFILMVAFLFLIPSCVSKKKFVEMSRLHTVAEKRADALHEENDILKSDFEAFKRESESEGAEKQRTIDSLRLTINSLNHDINSEKDNIEDRTFNFQVESGKLSQQLTEKDKEIRNLTREFNTLKVQVDDLNRELNKVKSGSNFPFGSVKQLERKIEAKDKEIAVLDSCLKDSKQEILLLNEKINLQALTIEKLSFEKDSIDHVLLDHK